MIPILNILYYEVDQCNFEVLAKQPDGLQPGRYSLNEVVDLININKHWGSIGVMPAHNIYRLQC